MNADRDRSEVPKRGIWTPDFEAGYELAKSDAAYARAVGQQPTPAVSVSGAACEATEAQVLAAQGAMSDHYAEWEVSRARGRVSFVSYAAQVVADAVAAAGPVDAELAAVVAERDALRADVERWESDFPCDSGCLEYPEEDCSRHGRKPDELWERVERQHVRADRAEATRDEAHAVLNRIAAFAQNKAVVWRARGGGDAERAWLDLLAILERHAILDADPAPEPQADSKPGQNLEVEHATDLLAHLSEAVDRARDQRKADNEPCPVCGGDPECTQRTEVQP